MSDIKLDNSHLSRRDFLKIAGATAAGLVFGDLLGGCGSENASRSTRSVRESILPVPQENRLTPEEVSIDGHHLAVGEPKYINVPGFTYYPDTATSVVPSGNGVEMYTSVGRATQRLEGPDLNNLQTSGVPVIVPGNYDWEKNYAGAGTVLQVPGGNAGDRLAIYHGERWGNDQDGSNFQASIGMAYSADGGRTWKKIGQPIIRGMLRLDPASPDTNRVSGAGQPSAVIGPDGFLYVFHTKWGDPQRPKLPDAIHLARAPLNSCLRPEAWKNYVQDGGFVSPAASGGRSDPVILPPEGANYAALASASNNSVLGKVLLIFEGQDSFCVTTIADLAHPAAAAPQRLLTFPQTREQELAMPSATWWSYPGHSSAVSSQNTGADLNFFCSQGVRAFGAAPIEPHHMVRQPLTIT